MASTSKSAEASQSARIVQVNASLYELNRPVGRPSIQVVFFHGLVRDGDFSDAHRSAWRSEDGTCCWPQTWLVEEIPGAHVFSVSCGGCLGKTSTERFDLFLQAENLISDILDANIGQESLCPVVLVGHSIGGLVIKEVCCQAFHKVLTTQGIQNTRLKNFLNSLKGVFYYATPHRGSPVAEQLAAIIGSPLLNYFKALSKEAARLDDKFEQMCKSHDIRQFANLGENLPTKLGLFGEVIVVPEASARGSNFNVDEMADHFSICRPEGKFSRRFKKLKGFLVDITSEMKERHRPDNFQWLPKAITGIGVQLQEAKRKLKEVKSLGLVGMGGLGKTTLAMALFNDLCCDFEYTCFVRSVKDGIGSLEKQVWNNVHFKGKKLGNGEPEWIKLRDERLLLVLDDIAGDYDISQVLNNTSPESRIIVTSRERDLSERSVDAVHDVQFLGAESTQSLFMSHAFPGQEMAPALYSDLMDAIVTRCEGLPLTLEVFGQFLKKKEKVEDWRQTLNALGKAEAVKGFDQRLWAKLRISYDGLQEKEKKMFLDATTFFCAKWVWTLGDAKAAWSGAYDTDCVNVLWQTLVDMCLVYQIEDFQWIKVHDQLQSLGRRIAEEPKSEYQCMLWDTESILKPLQEEPELSDLFKVFKECSPRFRVLGFGSAIAGSRQDAKSFLLAVYRGERWGLQNFCSAVLSQLVSLNLRGAFNLDNADCMSHCDDVLEFVDRVPESDGFLCMLWRAELFKREKLPDSFGQLLNLQRLEIFDCSFNSLPDSFGQLPKLQHLEISKCSELKSLPDSFGQLPKLQHLKISKCSELKSLPDSFGQLSKLQQLTISDCNLNSLPYSFRQLSKLQDLKLRDLHEIELLLECFAGMVNLSDLRIVDLGLRTIPDLQCLPSLHSLRLVRLPYVKELPPWLEGVDVTLLSVSEVALKISGGRFTVIEASEEQSFSKTYPSKVELPNWVHKIAMAKVEAGDYRAAVRGLCANLGALDRDNQAFMLQERGLAKRLAGDSCGALEDLTAAWQVSGDASTEFFSVYDCRKHLGFVKFLLGDLEGAKHEGGIAVELGRSPGQKMVTISPNMGEERVEYLHFRLRGSRGGLSEQMYWEAIMMEPSKVWPPHWLSLGR